jgi:hypothetical protein
VEVARILEVGDEARYRLLWPMTFRQEQSAGTGFAELGFGKFG